MKNGLFFGMRVLTITSISMSVSMASMFPVFANAQSGLLDSEIKKELLKLKKTERPTATKKTVSNQKSALNKNNKTSKTSSLKSANKTSTKSNSFRTQENSSDTNNVSQVRQEPLRQTERPTDQHLAGALSVSKLQKQTTSDKPWKIRYRTYNTMSESDFSNVPGGDKELLAWDRIDFTYNISKKIGVGIMPQYFHTWFGDPNKPQDPSQPNLSQHKNFYWDNTALFINGNNLWTENDFAFNMWARYYLPTSERMIKDESNGMSRIFAGFGKKIGKFSVEINEQYYKWYQQYTSSSLVDPEKKDSFGRPLPLQNMDYRFDTALDFNFEATSWLTLFWEFGIRHQSRYADVPSDRPAQITNYFFTNPEVTFTFNKYSSLSLGVVEMPDSQLIDQHRYLMFESDPNNQGEVYFMLTLQY